MPPLATASGDDGIQISPLTEPTIEDFTGIFTTSALSLGRQTHDLFWTTFNPDYETDEGIPRGAEMLRHRWEIGFNSINASGERNAAFVVATVPRTGSDGAEGAAAEGREIIGAARYVQLSLDPKHGVVPPLNEEDARTMLNVEVCAPGDPARQNYLTRLFLGSSLQRAGILKEKMDQHERGELDGPPAVLALDLCAVRPAWQGKGIGKALVQWGNQLAQRRGNLECITEGSVMGRRVYAKCGYREVKESAIDVGNGEIVRTGTVVMRTGKSSDK